MFFFLSERAQSAFSQFRRMIDMQFSTVKNADSNDNLQDPSSMDDRSFIQSF